jgi:hypothetical protein
MDHVATPLAGTLTRPSYTYPYDLRGATMVPRVLTSAWAYFPGDHVPDGMGNHLVAVWIADAVDAPAFTA